MFTLFTLSSNNKFRPDDKKHAVLRKFGSAKIIRKILWNFSQNKLMLCRAIRNRGLVGVTDHMVSYFPPHLERDAVLGYASRVNRRCEFSRAKIFLRTCRILGRITVKYLCILFGLAYLYFVPLISYLTYYVRFQRRRSELAIL